jgi:hypothetical protein
MMTARAIFRWLLCKAGGMHCWIYFLNNPRRLSPGYLQTACRKECLRCGKSVQLFEAIIEIVPEEPRGEVGK